VQSTLPFKFYRINFNIMLFSGPGLQVAYWKTWARTVITK